VKSLRLLYSALVMGALVISLAGCGKSASTVAPSTVSLDTTPPDAPTNLTGSYDAAGNRDYLNWNASTAADLAGYEVWEYSADPASGATGRLVASADASADGVALPPTSDAGTHWFRVRALDEAGNKSSYSATATHDLHAWTGSTSAPGDRGLDGGL
jgi:hypothetical protein